MRSLSVLALLSFVTLGYAIPGPDPLTGNTTLHDASMCKGDSGKYFVFSTGVGIEIRTSTDRTAWTFAGRVWPDGAPWTDKYAANGYVPDSDSKITTLSYLLIDGDKWYLSFGSFWTGTKSLNINPSNGLPSDNQLTPLAQSFHKLGSLLQRHFLPTGGFVDQSGIPLTKGGTLVLSTHDNIVGPGSEDLMLDDDSPLLVYHYHAPGGNFLGINHLKFSTGWPVVV